MLLRRNADRPWLHADLVSLGCVVQGNWWVFMLTFLLTLTIGVVVRLQSTIKMEKQLRSSPA